MVKFREEESYVCERVGIHPIEGDELGYVFFGEKVDDRVHTDILYRPTKETFIDACARFGLDHNRILDSVSDTTAPGLSLDVTVLKENGYGV